MTGVEPQELLRLKAIACLDPESGPEAMFDRVARLVREVLGFPDSLVSLVDDRRHIIKSLLPDGTCFGNLTDNFCALAVRGTSALVVEDATLIAPYRDFEKVRHAPFIRSYWGAPLKTAAGFNVGTLAVFDYVPRTPTDRDLCLLNQFAHMTIEMMELRAAATIDVLTGTNTRRMFDAMGQTAMRNVRDTGAELSCIVVDIDHFKLINDEHGHAVGDAVLVKVGEILNSAMRANDVVGRIGGEEFAIALPGVGSMVAFKVAERIRQRLEQVSDARLPKFTASFGVAEVNAADTSLAEAVKRADAALYAAKHGGRNKTVISTNTGAEVSAVLLAG